MTTSTTNRPIRSRFGSLIRQLWFQVVVGAIAGIAVGILLPDIGAAVSPLNDWFIGLVKMIGIDRILNEGRIFINVLGNALGAIVIGKWEKGFDHQRAREVLAGKHEFVIEDDESDEDTTTPRVRSRNPQPPPTDPTRKTHRCERAGHHRLRPAQR
jgi:hypothetical protein